MEHHEMVVSLALHLPFDVWEIFSIALYQNSRAISNFPTAGLSKYKAQETKVTEK